MAVLRCTCGDAFRKEDIFKNLAHFYGITQYFNFRPKYLLNNWLYIMICIISLSPEATL